MLLLQSSSHLYFNELYSARTLQNSFTTNKAAISGENYTEFTILMGVSSWLTIQKYVFKLNIHRWKITTSVKVQLIPVCHPWPTPLKFLPFQSKQSPYHALIKPAKVLLTIHGCPDLCKITWLLPGNYLNGEKPLNGIKSEIPQLSDGTLQKLALQTL